MKLDFFLIVGNTNVIPPLIDTLFKTLKSIVKLFIL